MNARTRKALGCFGLLAYLAAYVVLATAVGGALVDRAPAWAHILYFAIAGIAWVLPLKPLFRWMNRGA